MKRYSILNNLDYCYFCGRPAECIHEVYFGKNRQVSIKNGLCVGLCNYHHNMSDQSVHFNKEMNKELRQVYQRAFEKIFSREEFMSLIGENFL